MFFQRLEDYYSTDSLYLTQSTVKQLSFIIFSHENLCKYTYNMKFSTTS